MSDQYIVEAQAFYDLFVDKLLRDYLYGNPRTVAAIRWAISTIPAPAAEILDIGCGIGWTSSEVKCALPESKVLGLDISSELIAVADALFSTDGLSYSSVNILDEDVSFDSRYDAILLLDVYEHIPNDKRARFHARLSQLLAEDGIVVLTCPTISHQSYLRQYQPDGLQPVDEDVSREDIGRLATDVGDQVARFQEVTIWKPTDYFHALVARGTYAPASLDGASVALCETLNERSERLARRLGWCWWKPLTPQALSIHIRRTLFPGAKSAMKRRRDRSGSRS